MPNSAPNRPGVFEQGVYNPKNPSKYQGDLSKAYFRSSYEYRFCYQCDHDPSILAWGLETVAVPYELPDADGGVKVHNYYPDFKVSILRPGSTQVQVYLIEVKPYRQTLPPKAPRRPNPKNLSQYQYALHQYQVNQYKWRSAQAFCEKYGYLFRIITEIELGLKAESEV